MRWLLWVLWNPLDALDLRGADGKPDHGKVIGFLGFLAIYLTIFLGLLPPLGHTIALLSVIFGWAGWRSFLKSRTALATEERTVVDETVRVIRERRAGQDVEPTDD